MKKIRISLLALFALTAVGMSSTSFSFEPGFERYICSLHSVMPGYSTINVDNKQTCISILVNQKQTLWENHKSQAHPNEPATEIDPDHCVKVDPLY